MSKKKVLIVSYYFPPLNSMAAKRYGYMCKYLEENGYIPYILTTRQRSGVYLGCKADLEIPIKEKQIIRIGSQGWKYPITNVFWLFLSEYLKERNLNSRVVNELALGWYEKVIEKIDIDKLKDIDVVIGTYPPIGNILLAKYYARKLNVPYIAEVRDLISDYIEVPCGKKRAKKLDLILERMILGNAQGIVTVTKGFENILKKRYSWIKITTVYNGWDIEGDLRKGFADKKIIYYAGSLYQHRIESLKLLINAIKDDDELKEYKIIIRSLGPNELEVELQKYIEVMNMQDRVKWLPPASEKVVKKEQESAFINLLPSSIYENDKALLTTIPGKLFELLKYAAPILAIIPKKSEVSEILEVTNKGIATTNISEVREFLKNNSLEYIGNENIYFYSREYQAKQLCNFMDKI